ncbi:MAG: RND family transporter [Gammaproteobacteria bacterium]|nr:RND family transporter [Gammaproteobacteria bacterium]
MFRALAELFDRVVLANPKSTLVVLVALLIAFGAGIPKFRVDASADSLLLENDADLKRFRELGKRYSTKDFLFVTVTPTEGLFSPASRALIAAMRADLKALPDVDSVLTILDVPLVKNVEARLSEVASKYKTLESPDVDFDRARDELLTSPLYKNVAISADGRTTAIRIMMKERPEFRRLQMERGDLVYLRATTGLSPEQAARLADIDPIYKAQKVAVDEANHAAVESIRSVLTKYRDEARVHLGGIAMITDDLITFVRSDIVVFGIGAVILAISMLGYIFREARWVAIPLSTCVFCTVVILGMLGHIGWDLTVISSNFIALTLILTISVNIHLLVRYMELYREFPDWSQYQLVRQMTHDMAKPCMYTNVTSMIGFVSLVTSDIKPIIDFGWMMTLSLAIVFVILFTFIPAVMLLMPKRPLKVEDKGSASFTVSLARFTDRHGLFVLIASLAITALGVIGMGRLEVENSFINYFKQDTEIYQGLKQVDETLGGTTPLEIVLKFPPPAGGAPTTGGGDDDELAEMFEEEPAQKSDYWFTPEKVERIKRVHDFLETVPGIGKVTSLASIVRVAEDLNKGREFDPFELNIIYKRLPDNLKQEMLSPYISIDDDEARIAVRILDSTPGLRREALLADIEQGLEQQVGLKPAEYEIAGLLVLYNNMLQSLYSSQIESLGWALLGVMLTLWVLFRSFKAAVIGVIPNAIAAAAVLGFMGWAGIPLDMMTIMVASLTIGIAVEDCIHYLYRYGVEFQHIRDGLKTMYHCHTNIAKAGFYTTLTVCCGFSILVLSNFVPSIIFGILTTVAMTVAILGALTLMPKLILMWKPFGR